MTDWTKKEFKFNSGENDSIRILFKQMCDVGGEKTKADVYIDDVEMHEAEITWVE